MSEYNLKGNEIVKAQEEFPEVEIESVSVNIPEERLFAVERRSKVSEWSEPEIVHQLAIQYMTKPERMKILSGEMMADTEYWQAEFKACLDAQLLHEAVVRNIDPVQARRSLFSI